MIPAADGQTLYRRIRAELIDRILDGQLKAGDELPSEAELCAQFRVSRGPVRQALEALKREGYVSSSRGRRSTVMPRLNQPSAPIFVSFSSWARAIGKPCTCTVLGVSRGKEEEFPFTSAEDPRAPQGSRTPQDGQDGQGIQESIDAADTANTVDAADTVDTQDTADTQDPQYTEYTQYTQYAEGTEGAADDDLLAVAVTRFYEVESRPVLWEKSWYPARIALLIEDWEVRDDVAYEELREGGAELFQTSHHIDLEQGGGELERSDASDASHGGIVEEWRAAAASAAESLGAAKGEYMLRERRTLYDSDGRIEELSLRFYHPDRISFVVNARGEDSTSLSIVYNEDWD